MKEKLAIFSLAVISLVGCCDSCKKEINNNEELNVVCTAEGVCEVITEENTNNNLPIIDATIKNQQSGFIQADTGKRIWANSFLFAEAPKLEVEKWVTAKPEMKDKYILLEFWNTWCPPCRKSMKMLDDFQKKFKNELVVIAITDESEVAMNEMKKKYGVDLPSCYLAIDSQMRTKKAFGVIGVPHAVIIEPFDGAVVWEGFPNLPDYELKEEMIEKILSIGRKIRAEKLVKN